MDFDITEYLKLLEDKKQEEIKVKNTISEKETEFKKSIKPLKDNQIKIRRQIGELKGTKIQLRLCDLIDELSNLSGINTKNISSEIRVTIDCSGYKNIEDVLRKKLPKEQLRLLIVGSKKLPFHENHPHPFYFSIKLPFNFFDIQADGKNFFEHCSLKVKNNSKDKKQYIEFLVTENIQDIICNFSLATLTKEEKESWYPAPLINQAIINCASKQHSFDTKKAYEKKS